MKTHKLKSGRSLEIGNANFRDAKKLLDAVLKELKAEKMDADQEIDVNFLKGTLLGVISSEAVEAAIWPCLARSLYEKQRITVELFETPEAREDFLEICYEVGKETLLPFMKNLYAEFAPFLGNLELSLK